MDEVEVRIREATRADADRVWEIISEVIAGGDTYAFAPDTPKEDMLKYWFGEGAHPFVALVNGEIAGTFVIKNNQPGLGSHVANAGFMTASAFRGYGVGNAMGKYALKAAYQRGFLAMQFNFVVKSNTGAVALWEKLGFRIMAEIPDAYRHTRLGLTSVYIMHRSLHDQ